MNTRCGKRTPAGFTLVELLVVMAIIGVLVAILLPTIYFARVRAIETRITMEISQLDAAVEAYKQRYGDYPPDFSDPAVVQRHLNTCFPRIAPSESAMIVELAENQRVDRAEALVLMVGGLSDNPQRPFTGEGGPLFIDENGNASYNPDRNVGFFEFDIGRLTLEMDGNGRWISYDERELLGGSSADNDPFPVYPPRGYQLPYVYFDSRSYLPFNPQESWPPMGNAVYPPIQSPVFANSPFGWAVPYLDDPPQDASGPRFQNPRSFQILSAGMDENYGAPSTHKVFPTGQNFDMDLRADHDNIANFSQGPFRDSLP